MPTKWEWLFRIRAVEREFVAMREAADHFQRASIDDPTILRKLALRPREIVAASDNLDGTYVIRLLAEFETGVRQYWAVTRSSEPRLADLLNGLAAERRIPHARLENVHAVREYRNALVHERDDEVEIIPIPMARSHLCHFFSFLPPQW
jgi:hypothetical protein